MDIHEIERIVDHVHDNHPFFKLKRIKRYTKFYLFSRLLQYNNDGKRVKPVCLEIYNRLYGFAECLLAVD